MRIRQAILITILLLPLLQAQANVVLTLQPTVSVRGTQVKLTDLVTITGTPEEQQRFAHVIIGMAPSPGEGYVFTAGMVRMSIRQYGIETKEYTLDGPASVNVIRRERVVTGASLVSGAVAWLQDRLTAAGMSGEVTAVRQPEDITLPEGKINWQYEEMPTSTAVRRDIAMTAQIEKDVFWHGLVQLTVQVTLAGTSAAPGTSASVQVAGSHESTPSPKPQTAVVKCGAEVPVRARCGALVITTLAIACEDGQPGMMIRVKNAKSLQDFMARVTADGQLELVQ